MQIRSLSLAIGTTALLLLGSTGPAFGDETPEPTSTESVAPAELAAVGTINGVVVDADTAAPMQSQVTGELIPATVFLWPASDPQGEATTVDSADDGTFTIQADPGDYLLGATQTLPGAVWEHINRIQTDGVVPEAQLVPVTVPDGATVNVTLEMHRAATLTLGPISASDAALANGEWYAVAKYFAPGESQGNASDGVITPVTPLVGPDPTLTVYITYPDAYRPDAVVWGCVYGPAPEQCSEPGLKATPGAALTAGPFVFASNECSGAGCGSPPAPPAPPQDELPDTGSSNTPALVGVGLVAVLLGIVLRIAFRRDTPAATSD